MKGMAPFKNMELWFVANDATGKSFTVYTQDSEHTAICEVSEVSGKLQLDNIFGDWVEDMVLVETEFQKFQTRPEYLLSTYGLDTEVSVEEEPDVYDALLEGAYLMRAYEHVPLGIDIDESLPKFQSGCIGWLQTTDFYTSPASTRYHENYPGGLLHHTLEVAKHIKELLVIPSFAAVNLQSAMICALTHDWCKIGLYEQYMRNVKDENGNWQQVPNYRRRDSVMVPMGHGVSSYFLATKFFKLTIDEAAAIRWHMGAWYVCESEMNDLQQSNETFPVVHLLQFADQLAITKYGNSPAK